MFVLFEESEEQRASRKHATSNLVRGIRIPNLLRLLTPLKQHVDSRSKGSVAMINSKSNSNAKLLSMHLENSIKHYELGRHSPDSGSRTR
jgi:hypothetical protein